MNFDPSGKYHPAGNMSKRYGQPERLGYCLEQVSDMSYGD